MRRSDLLVVFAALSVGACASDSGENESPSIHTRPPNELAATYTCPDGTEVQISDSGFTIGTDPELHPEVNTKQSWTMDSLIAAAC